MTFAEGTDSVSPHEFSLEELFRNLPEPDPEVKASILSYPEAKAILADPESHPESRVAKARVLVGGVGPAIVIPPFAGDLPPRPAEIVAIGISCTSDTQGSFASYEATQGVLLKSAHLAEVPMPPHVLLPKCGIWTYVLISTTKLETLRTILVHLRHLYPDLQVSLRSPAEASADIPIEAAAGVAGYALKESRALLSSRTSSSQRTADLPSREGLADGLLAVSKDIWASIKSRRRPATTK
eukprot:GFKZ01005822.1.p1 GENE.GFKZ01005822.1~~GFKZ01005822.1.p1  ORF type:complete len:269 (+),score=14.78 GFKZ01005822.1:89-808(+)